MLTPLGEAGLIVAAALVMYLGFGLLAVCQRTHWRRLAVGHEVEGPSPRTRRRARWGGSLGLGLGLFTSLVAQGPSFGSLLFGLLLGAASLAVTFTLTYRPQWLRPLRAVLQRNGDR